jgi:hypothetical protein
MADFGLVEKRNSKKGFTRHAGCEHTAEAR